MTPRGSLPVPRHVPVAGRVAFLYILVGCLWVLFSDRLLEMLLLDPAVKFRLQTLKGWIFVLATGTGLYLLVRYYVMALRKQEEALREMVCGVAETTGESFFRSLAEHLARALEVDFVAVGELVGEEHRSVRSVAAYARGRVTSDFECDLARSACAEVLKQSFFYLPDDVQERFPADHVAKDIGARGYMGTLLRDSARNPIGLLVVMNSRPLRHDFPAALLHLFAARAAIELERKRSEEVLRLQFDQITTIFDSLNALVYVVDMESHQLIYMNRYGEELFGRTWEGRHCYDVLQEGSDPCQYCSNEQLKAGGVRQKPLLWEYRNSVNGKWYQCIDKAIQWPDGRLVRLEIAIDITDRKEIERLKDEILSAVSHEMRTPLTAIMGYAEYLLENEIPPDERKGFLGVLYQEAERLNDLISDFLQLQRLQARRTTYQLRPLPVRDLLERAARPFVVFADIHRIRFDFPPALPDVQGEERSLLEVVEKLISNAVKYSPAGGEIVLGAREEGQKVVIFVRDTGQGIPPGELDRVFDRFYRVDNSDRRQSGGTGLGLSLVREIIRAHGGRVWAESTFGAGSTFYIALPAASPPGEETPSS